jgi:membrane fusion protein (multidrug efflux system)
VAERYSHLLTIADPTTLITEVSVSELILPELHVGNRALVRIDALGPAQYQGVITRTHPSLDPLTRLGIIEVQLNPVPVGALPGQLCRVTLETHVGNRLVIPFRALRRDSKGEYVFVVNDEGKTVRIGVNTGLRIDEQIEILPGEKGGLSEGQQVITRGFLSLKAGIKVKRVQLASDPEIQQTAIVKPE